MKDIKGYEGLYAITSCGKVWSYKRKIFLKPQKDRKGYLKVLLYKDGKPKGKFIHRLVMETYCPVENIEDLQVNHKDEIKEHNYLNNLEWCDAKYNCNYGTHNERVSATLRNNSKLKKRVRCIETGVIYESTREAARQTGIAQQSISACCRGKLKTAGGYHWEFVD